jgi:hypothetical protein
MMGGQMLTGYIDAQKISQEVQRIQKLKETNPKEYNDEIWRLRNDVTTQIQKVTSPITGSLNYSILEGLGESRPEDKPYLDRLTNRASGAAGDLELYSSQSQNYFRNLSTQVASSIPLGPHTPLPHPGYVRPQNGHIPRPNLRGMPGPMGNPMPWGWQPTLLAKGGITNFGSGGLTHTIRATGPVGPYPGLEKYKPTDGSIKKPSGLSKLVTSAVKTFLFLRNLTPAGAAAAVMMPRATADGTLTGALQRGDYKPMQGPPVPERLKRRSYTPRSSAVTSRQAPEVQKPVDPFAADNEKYRQLISQGKTEEAEKLGMEIWSRKYADTSMMKPKTQNPMMNPSSKLEVAQSNMRGNNQNKTPDVIPLPPDYIKIPGKKAESKVDTTELPEGVNDMPMSIFRKESGNYK